MKKGYYGIGIQETPEPTQEKHECEQGTFCVECGRDNRESNFSKFFRTASPEEKAKVFTDVAKAANEDQRKILTQKEWLAQPTSDWEEAIIVEVLEDYLYEAAMKGAGDESLHLERMRGHFEKLKTFIRQIEAQAEERGRREASEDIDKQLFEAIDKRARLATITLFEEWGNMQGRLIDPDDLLAFAESLKKKV